MDSSEKVLNATVKMTVETDVDLKDVIMKFRGPYIYKELCGTEYKDSMSNHITVKCNDKPIYPSTNANANRDYFVADYRRILGRIIQYVYCERKCKINKIIISTKRPEEDDAAYKDIYTYTDIDNIYFEGEKFDFSAKLNNQYVIIGMPVNIFEDESKLYPYSQAYLYCLQNDNCKLQLFTQYYVYTSDSVDERYTYTIDLLFGKNKDRKGIYYYWNNELVPQYEIEEKNGQYILHWSDIRLKVCEREIQADNKTQNYINFAEYLLTQNSTKGTVYISETDKNIIACIEKILNSKILKKEDYKEFCAKIQDYIYQNEYYKKDLIQNQIAVMDGLPYNTGVLDENYKYIKGTKQPNGTYKFDADKDKGIYYYAEPTRLSLIYTDYLYYFKKLGIISINDGQNNLYIQLTPNKEDWIIGYSGKDKVDIKADLKILRKIESFNPQILPSLCLNNTGNNNKNEYPADYVVEEIIEHTNEIIYFKNYFEGIIDVISENKDYITDEYENVITGERKNEVINSCSYLADNSVSQITADINFIKIYYIRLQWWQT